ncbi:MAG: hypothetical protein QW165_03485 [Candidatus Woesearchaeota archaeon]
MVKGDHANEQYQVRVCGMQREEWMPLSEAEEYALKVIDLGKAKAG